MKKPRVGIIGAGNMGEAIIKGLVRRRKFNVCVYDKNRKRLNLIYRRYQLKKIPLPGLIKSCGTIIICVKPQDIDALLKSMNLAITSKHLIISIAAGVTTRHIEKAFKKKPAVVRVMPNLPGLIGEGISAYCLGKAASKNSAEITGKIFSSIGQTLKIAESKMNAVTAISGSGPGFIAYLTDCLITAARKQGLTKEAARFLCLYTLKGTISLLTQTDLLPSLLLKRVASKGGTTEAGVNVFKKQRLSKIINAAIKAAAQRAKQLSNK